MAMKKKTKPSATVHAVAVLFNQRMTNSIRGWPVVGENSERGPFLLIPIGSSHENIFGP